MRSSWIHSINLNNLQSIAIFAVESLRGSRSLGNVREIPKYISSPLVCRTTTENSASSRLLTESGMTTQFLRSRLSIPDYLLRFPKYPEIPPILIESDNGNIIGEFSGIQEE